MSKKAFDKIMEGLSEALDHAEKSSEASKINLDDLSTWTDRELAIAISSAMDSHIATKAAIEITKRTDNIIEIKFMEK